MRCLPCREEILSVTRFVNHAARVHAVNRARLTSIMSDCDDPGATLVRDSAGKVYVLVQAPLPLEPSKIAHSGRSGRVEPV
jgi:hypothetical protein